MIDTIVVPMDRYLDLLEAEKFIDALREAGVDNWDGYSHALEIWKENKE